MIIRFRLTFFLFIGIIIYIPELMAQQELVLRKSYKPKTLLRINVGDEIKFVLKNDPVAYSEIIVALTDSTISFPDLTIPFAALKAIYIERNSFARNALLNGAGAGLQVFSIYHVAYGNLNSTIAKGWTSDFFTNNLLIGTIGFATGTTLRFIYKKTKYRKCKIGKYRLTYFSY